MVGNVSVNADGTVNIEETEAAFGRELTPAELLQVEKLKKMDANIETDEHYINIFNAAYGKNDVKILKH